MKGRALCAMMAAMVLLATPVAAQARVQCVAFARAHSLIQLAGNARDWWGNALGIYQRGQAPRPGSVLAFRATGSMPMGHVAVVSKVIDDRHVLLDHANWSRPGQVERGVVAVDVSAAGDWSAVRVWHSPSRSLGMRVSPAFGFIYPVAEAALATVRAVGGAVGLKR